METKRCRKCGEVKGVEEFYVDRSYKDSYKPRCKGCISQLRHEHYMKTREKSIEQSKQWRINNPQRFKELMANYHVRRKAEHKEKMRVINREHSANLTDTYVRCKLGKTTPPELIEMKRQQLLAHRALKEFQKLLKEQTK